MSKEKKREKKRRYEHGAAKRRFWQLPLAAIGLALLVEGLNKGSVPKLMGYLANYPLYFLFNALIILTSLTFSELFKRRRAVLYIIALVWVGLGIGEYVVVRERIQPFTSMDVLMIKDFFSLTTVYYTWVQIIAVAVLSFLLVVLVVLLITRLPRRRRVNYVRSTAIFAGLLTICFCIYTIGVSYGLFPKYYENLVEAYDKYGFATCFTFTFGNRGVTRPSDYSTEVVTDILSELGDTPAEPVQAHHVFDEDDNLKQPNIVFVQLESFFDVNTVIGAKYSADPTPNFNKLSREFPSGELYVPSIGGGTANVEFEVLTGMNLDFFGVGEYPYNTVLHDNTCESVPYNLQDQGYKSTVMHNHSGTFYSRNEVYGQLGFDKFVSLEYMPYVEYTDIGWAQDTILTGEIIKAMRATEERDFVMAITVETHGKYDAQYTAKEGDIEVLELPGQMNKNQFTHFINLLHDTDGFIGELIEAFDNYDEPVICVFYGDHLPALELSADILTTENLYASRYILWNNFGLKLDACDLQAYRLSANLLKQLGMPGGVISQLHQSNPADDASEEYLQKLELLEYDVLYGQKDVYEGVSPYAPTDLQLGSVPIEITGVSTKYGRLLVNGKNFTECSAIVVGDQRLSTAFISSAQIVAVLPKELTVTELCVAQMTSDGVELSRTEPFALEE